MLRDRTGIGGRPNRGAGDQPLARMLYFGHMRPDGGDESPHLPTVVGTTSSGMLPPVSAAPPHER